MIEWVEVYHFILWLSTIWLFRELDCCGHEMNKQIKYIGSLYSVPDLQFLG